MSVTAGRAAEERAAEYLRRCGLRIVGQNYHCRYGEIDLIAEDDNVLVFVEVRLRRHISSAAESIDYHKRKRIQSAAMHYLSDTGERPCRFDAVLVDAGGKILWLKDVF